MTRPQEVRKTKNKLILMVLKTPPPFGGGEIRGAALREYVKDDHDILVLEIKSKRRNKGNQSNFAFWKIAEFISTLVRFILLIVRHRPKLIFYPMAKSFPHFFRDSIFFWTAWILQTPFAGELAGASFYFLGRNKIQTLYGQFVLSRMACLRVLGYSIARWFEDFGITNTIVSDNGIESVAVNMSQNTSNLGTGLRIMCVGTLSPQKGLGLLVDACINIANKGRLFEIHCLGEWISDAFKVEIKDKLSRNGISDHFVFHGLSHGIEKNKILSNGHLLVLPSYIEGQPLVILEALSCGLPVISTKVGAIPDTIADGENGFLIETGNIAQLESKILLLMDNPDLRKKMAHVNLELYNRRFTKEAFLKTQVYWIRQCANGNLHPHGQFIKAPCI